MKIQNFEPTARTLRDFQDFCARLESALEESPAYNKSNKISGQENGHKKHCRNNNNNKGSQKHYYMLHGNNPMHSTY